MEEKLRLFLLSVGSPAGQGCIDALAGRRAHCTVIGTNSLADAAGNFRCDAVHLAPPAASGEPYLRCIEEAIRAERPELVIPTQDDDALALASLAERAAAGGTVLLAGSVASAVLMTDKLETARFAARHGLPYPPTAATVDEALALAACHPLPLIGKPRSGKGARGVVLLRSREEIARAFEARADLVVQPYLDPPANVEAVIAACDAGRPLFFSFPEKGIYTAQIVVAPDGRISTPFATVDTAVGGQAWEYRRCDDPGLLEAARAYGRAAAAEGWTGPMSVELKRTASGAFVAFAVKPRFSDGAGARLALGYDEIAELVRWFLPGRTFPAAPVPAADLVQHYLKSYPVPRDAVHALEAAGRWSA